MARHVVLLFLTLVLVDKVSGALNTNRHRRQTSATTQKTKTWGSFNFDEPKTEIETFPFESENAGKTFDFTNNKNPTEDSDGGGLPEGAIPVGISNTNNSGTVFDFGGTDSTDWEDGTDVKMKNPFEGFFPNNNDWNDGELENGPNDIVSDTEAGDWFQFENDPEKNYSDVSLGRIRKKEAEEDDNSADPGNHRTVVYEGLNITFKGGNDKSDAELTNSVYGNTTLRPIGERTCNASGEIVMDCVHGLCVKVIDNSTESSFSSYECHCDKGWTKGNSKCNIPCWIDCGHGSCYVTRKYDEFKEPGDYTEADMHCGCHSGWTGERCQSRRTDYEEEARDAKVLASAFATSAAVLLALLIGVPILLWRLRVIIVMKIYYYFQKFEDNDGKMYDAYLSMSNTTSALEFVQNKLLPRLEAQGFKIYVEARDRPVGNAIGSCIVSAVQESRRTIMLVTPEYITGEWSRFEWLVAQHESIQLRQRIIPIILENVDKEQANMDRNLKLILNSFKCLSYPKAKLVKTQQDKPDQGGDDAKRKQAFQKKEEKFFKRLQLTMPKKKTMAKKNVKGLDKLAKEKEGDVEKGEHNKAFSKGNDYTKLTFEKDGKRTLHIADENDKKDNSVDPDIRKNIINLNTIDIFDEEVNQKTDKEKTILVTSVDFQNDKHNGNDLVISLD